MLSGAKDPGKAMVLMLTAALSLQKSRLQQEGQCRAEDQAAGSGLLLNPGFIPVWIS